MASFEPGEQRWVERLGNLRNVIRQEVIGRQLANHVEAGSTVLDVGCGQGTQALRLARRGCAVTGVDPSAVLLGRFASAAAADGLAVELVEGRIEDLDTLLGERRFDLVCAHGVLMYIADRRAAITLLARRVARADGRLSFTVRNGHALAMRPGLRGDWAGAIEAFDGSTYINELGVDARADRLEDITDDLSSADMALTEWFGVRIFNDAIPADTVPPTGAELGALLEAEETAGRRDPYRWMASQLHVVAERR